MSRSTVVPVVLQLTAALAPSARLPTIAPEVLGVLRTFSVLPAATSTVAVGVAGGVVVPQVAMAPEMTKACET